MPRRVKCHITGEYGTDDTFVKIKDKYYKSQEVYDADKAEKEKYPKLIDYVCKEFLGYEKGKRFPTSLGKIAKEYSNYGYDVLLEAFERNTSNIHYALENHQLPEGYNKISYMFAIAAKSIDDVKRDMTNRKKQSEAPVKTEIECNDLSAIGTKNRGKDISSFLDDNDL